MWEKGFAVFCAINGVKELLAKWGLPSVPKRGESAVSLPGYAFSCPCERSDLKMGGKLFCWPKICPGTERGFPSQRKGFSAKEGGRPFQVSSLPKRREVVGRVCSKCALSPQKLCCLMLKRCLVGRKDLLERKRGFVRLKALLCVKLKDLGVGKSLLTGAPALSC